MPTLRSLHRVLRLRSFYPLLLATALAGALLLGRMRLSGTSSYSFLFWNIFLAWVPYLVSLAMVALHQQAPLRRWTLALLGAIWFCFLPNAPYLITDLMHLRHNAEAPLIYDVGMLASVAWAGTFLAVASLRMVQTLVRQAYGAVISWLFVLTVIGFSGFGIYLGRMLRWNSWDVLVKYPGLKRLGLRLTPRGGHHRLVNGSPIPNILRGVIVGGCRVPTCEATKMRLINPVPFITIPTQRLGTGAARVARIDRLNRHPCQPGLVFNKCPKLRETPIPVPTSLGLPNRFLSAFLDPFEVFKSNRAPRPEGTLFGLRDQFLRKTMVDVRLKAALLPSVFLKAPLSRACPHGLQAIPPSLLADANLLYLGARVRLAVAVGGKIDDAEVNPQCVININGRWFLNLAGCQQIPLPVDQRQIGFAALGLQQVPLARATDERDGLPPRQRPDRDRRCSYIPAQNAIIVGNGPVRREDALGFAIKLIRIRHFRNTAHSHLGGQPKGSPDIGVAETMDIELAKGFGGPGRLTDRRARRVRRFQRLLQGTLLLRCRK